MDTQSLNAGLTGTIATPDDLVTPTIVPLIKIDKPDTGEWNPKVVWFADRVERQWEPA